MKKQFLIPNLTRSECAWTIRSLPPVNDPVVNDPVLSCRTEVAQRVQLAKASGGWEGTHVDFKLHCDSTPEALGNS